MAPEAPDDIVVVGDGALLAALTRARGARMRDIVATIQQHQDEAIRAPSRGVTEITGGPGTGKTVVALHRAAYLLYSERRRFEGGGILVVGPSTAYTAYIERVLPSLGEDSVTLRSLGDLVDAVSATRLDRPRGGRRQGVPADPAVARPGRRRASVPGAPTSSAPSSAARRSPRPARARRCPRAGLRGHPRNQQPTRPRALLAEAAWAVHPQGNKEEFLEAFDDLDRRRRLHGRVVAAGRPARGPALARPIPIRIPRYGRGCSAATVPPLVRALAAGRAGDRHVERRRRRAWSTTSPRGVGAVREVTPEERGFYEIDELDDAGPPRCREVGAPRASGPPWRRARRPARATAAGTIGRPGAMRTCSSTRPRISRRCSGGCSGVAGAMPRGPSSATPPRPPGPTGSRRSRARDEAFGTSPRRRFHMATNYRNAREIFDYAATSSSRFVPDADIPDAVRETGVHPVVAPLRQRSRSAAVADSLSRSGLLRSTARSPS
jgi:hypothetical protein